MPGYGNGDNLVVDSLLPEINGFTLDSIKIDNDFFKDKVTLIQFSTFACKGCIAEYEYLNDLWDEFEKNDKFNIIGIYPFNTFGLNEYIQSLKPEESSNPLKLTHSIYTVPEYLLMPECTDSEQKLNRCPIISQKMSVYGYPLVLIIDKNGVIRYKFGGFPKYKEKREDLVYNCREMIVELINE